MTYVDYIRFTSWELSAYNHLMALIPNPEKGNSKRWLQYHGRGGAHYFGGVGDQNGRRHYVVHVSGRAAHEYADRAWKIIENRPQDDVRTSRIDLQRTIRGELDFRALYDLLRAQERNTTLIESDTPTLYINNRASEFFVRLYVRAPGILRLEFECKGNLADQVTASYFAGHRLDGIYHLLKRRAKLPGYVESMFLPINDVTEELVKIERQADFWAKMSWAGDALGAIERLCATDDYRDHLIPLILDLSERLAAKFD